MEEENTYFKNVIKDAIKELKSQGYTYVFYREQLEVITEIFKGQVDSCLQDGFYKIILLDKEK